MLLVLLCAQDKELPSHGFLTGHRSVTAAAATTTVDSLQSTYFSPPLNAAANVIIIIIFTIIIIVIVVVFSPPQLNETRRVIIRVGRHSARECVRLSLNVISVPYRGYI